MSGDLEYRAQQDRKNQQLLWELLRDMPPYCAEFFRGIADETLPLTRLSYARDINIFFDFLLTYKPSLKDAARKDISLDELSALTLTDFEIYMDYLTYYERGEKVLADREAAKERKLSALRTFFGYLFKKQHIPSNVVSLVDMPKRHTKPIIRLEVDEVAKLLDHVEDGGNMTPKQKEYHELTKARDLAIIILLLGTGIRVSECVGINLNDLDFKVNGFKVVRKGGSSAILYFPDEVAEVLRKYLPVRREQQALPGHEQALFLSTQRKRIGVRAVENLVKKYAGAVAPLKPISPHKLRSTYGTNLYRETGDIYLVADALGHSDVNTTRRHYAAMSEDNRRLAAKKIRLRDDPPDDPLPPADPTEE